MPVGCETGTACLLQNFVDHVSGPAARDCRRGFLS